MGWPVKEEPVALDDEKALLVLRGYSEGRMPRRRAMEALGLESDAYPAFVDAMTRSFGVMAAAGL